MDSSRRNVIYEHSVYILSTPYCVTVEADEREIDEATGSYSTDLDLVFNRNDASEMREELIAKGSLVKNDLAGKDVWAVHVYEFNDCLLYTSPSPRD